MKIRSFYLCTVEKLYENLVILFMFCRKINFDSNLKKLLAADYRDLAVFPQIILAIDNINNRNNIDLYYLLMLKT